MPRVIFCYDFSFFFPIFDSELQNFLFILSCVKVTQLLHTQKVCNVNMSQAELFRFFYKFCRLQCVAVFSDLSALQCAKKLVCCRMFECVVVLMLLSCAHKRGKESDSRMPGIEIFFKRQLCTCKLHTKSSSELT